MTILSQKCLLHLTRFVAKPKTSQNSLVLWLVLVYITEPIHHQCRIFSGYPTDMPSIVAVVYHDLHDRSRQDQYASHLIEPFMQLILRKKVGEED